MDIFRKHTRVRDTLGLIIQPAFGLLSLLIQNLVRSVLIPVLGLYKPLSIFEEYTKH